MSSVSAFAPAFEPRRSSRFGWAHSREIGKRSEEFWEQSSSDDDSDDSEGTSQSEPEGGASATNNATPSNPRAQIDPWSATEDDMDDGDRESNLPSGKRAQNHGRVQQPPSDRTGLRKQHLAVLVAILHKCLLKGDYLRAGRAWGMLLRSENRGRPFDVRSHGRWGIGAEILLFRDGQLKQKQKQMKSERETGAEQHLDTNDTDELRNHRQASFFTQEGFYKAKDYYERLILQYPYRKHSPNATSALHFYPAMFGLWIYAVQENNKRILATSQESNDSTVGGDSDASTDTTAKTMRDASEIAARLDELLVSPPYSDQTELWRLRGMVALWMADLIDGGLGKRNISEEDDDSRMEIDQPGDLSEAEQAQRGEFGVRKDYFEAKKKAEMAFENASRLRKGQDANARRDVDP